MLKTLLCVLIIFSAGLTAQAVGDKWALLIGVDKCEAVGELKVCSADALALKSMLEQIGYPDNHITVLVDSNQSNINALPTIGNVERAIKRLAQVAEADDKILFFFSGHGVTYNGTSFLVPTDGDLAKGISLPWIKDQFAACKAKEKVMILDACHSGAAKGVSGITPDLKTVGNLVMLLSCEKEQVSWPDKQGRHSVFTSAILEGLSGKAANADRKVTHKNLAAYVRKSVKDWTYENRKNEQTPVMVADASGDIILADIALIKPAKVTINVTDAVQPQKSETIEQLLATGKFAEAVDKIDARTDLAWRTCVEHLDRLQTTINSIEAKNASVETDCVLLRTMIRDVSGDFCLWYEQAPREWQLACIKACNRMRDTLSALLEKLPEGESTTYIRLVNDFRTFCAVLAPQDEIVLPEKVNARYALLAKSLSKKQSALIPVSNEIWIDDISRRPLAIQVQTGTKELDDMILMYVPEGPVTIGSFGAANTQRVQVGLSGFYIAKWEVTTRQFRAFCDEMNRDYPPSEAVDPLQPMVGIRHREAVEFCDWLGRKLAAKGWQGECRLPSECEMEKAARGISIYQYSWGYRFDESGCVNAITSLGRPQLAKSANADISFHGVANLAGNISEWCCDDWVQSLASSITPKTRDMIVRQDGVDGVQFKVVKGGNYTCRESTQLEISARKQAASGSATKQIGFRIVLRPKD